MELFAKNEFKQTMFFLSNKIAIVQECQQKLKIQKKIKKFVKKIKKHYQAMEHEHKT